MNEEIERNYQPFKYTIIGKSTIINTTKGDYVVKKGDKKLLEIFNYLSSRNFDYFPKIVDDTRDDLLVYEYIKDTTMPNEQKADDLINIVSLLHNKTTYYKEVKKDTYDEIYENIISNINYLRDYYNNLYDTFFLEEYLSPNKYLLMCNIYKIFLSLNYCEKNLDDWYDLVKNENKQRVCLVHNNLELNHFIKSDKDYLISWDKAKTDSPILDLITLYKKEYYNYDFSIIINNYLNRYSWLEDELKLFLIIIALPPKIEITDNAYEDIKTIRKTFDYIYKTEELIKKINDKDK